MVCDVKKPKDAKLLSAYNCNLIKNGDREWMLPGEWHEWHQQIRKCY